MNAKKLTKERAAIVARHERSENTRQGQITRLAADHKAARERESAELDFIDKQIAEATAFEAKQAGAAA